MPKKINKRQEIKSNSDVFEIYLGTFNDNQFTWYSVAKFADATKAYKEYKAYVNTQLKYTDEELKKVWDTGRLDVELRRGSKLLNWVGIYSREVKALTEKEEKEAEKGKGKTKKKIKDSAATVWAVKDGRRLFRLDDYADAGEAQTAVEDAGGKWCGNVGGDACECELELETHDSDNTEYNKSFPWVVLATGDGRKYEITRFETPDECETLIDHYDGVWYGEDGKHWNMDYEKDPAGKYETLDAGNEEDDANENA